MDGNNMNNNQFNNMPNDMNNNMNNNQFNNMPNDMNNNMNNNQFNNMPNDMNNNMNNNQFNNMPNDNGYQPNNMIQPNQSPKNNKKLYIIIGVVIVLLILYFIGSSGNKDNSTNGNDGSNTNTNTTPVPTSNTNSTPVPTTNDNITNATDEELKNNIVFNSEKTEVGNVAIFVKNNNNIPVSFVVVVHLFDANGNELDNRRISYNPLAPGEEQVYKLITITVDNYDHHKIEIEDFNTDPNRMLVNMRDSIEIVSKKMYKDEYNITHSDVIFKNNASKDVTIKGTVLFYKNGKIYDIYTGVADTTAPGETSLMKASGDKTECDEYKVYYFANAYRD